MKLHSSFSPAEFGDMLEKMTQEEVDRLILHSETRIKYWVVASVMANLIALGAVGAPLIYYLGTMQAQTSAVALTIQQTAVNQSKLVERLNHHEIWESNAETWMIQQGFVPPRIKGEQK